MWRMFLLREIQAQELEDDLPPKMFTSKEAGPWFVNCSKKISVKRTKMELFWWGGGSAVTNPPPPPAPHPPKERDQKTTFPG